MRHFGTQYCDKKKKADIFEPWIAMTNQAKLLTNHKSRYFMFH